MSDSEPNGSVAAQTTTEQRRIRLDGTGIKNSYANTCHVASTKEEIILNFGLNQSWEHGQQEMQVQLTNRIILNPHAAKRLAMLLMGVMQQYERRFGVLDLGSQPSDKPGSPAPDGGAGTTRTKPQAVK